MRRSLLFASLTAISVLAQDPKDHPTGNRTTPPTINSVAPLGMARGMTVELTVEGLNLAKATGVIRSSETTVGRMAR